MNTASLTLDQKRDIYLSYLSDCLSVEQLAVRYKLSDEEMFNLLFEGKALFKNS
jgi:hypothetical protein